MIVVVSVFRFPCKGSKDNMNTPNSVEEYVFDVERVNALEFKQVIFVERLLIDGSGAIRCSKC